MPHAPRIPTAASLPDGLKDFTPLAEEPEIEKKMAKRGIVGYLCKMLARSNTELLVLALIFLKKLAIFKENLPEMRREKLVAALVGFVPHHTEAVLVSALRLLYNLSLIHI